jgi:hypothetical protein
MTSNTTIVGLRYAGTALATAFTFMGMMSILSADQVVSLKADLETLKTSVLSGYGAITDMLVILGPIAALWLGKLGISSGTVQAMISHLLQQAQGPASPEAVAAQHAIIQATSTIAQDKSIPSSQDATNALVAATVALPQVQTIVTDKKTADDSPSASVVAAPTIQMVS